MEFAKDLSLLGWQEVNQRQYQRLPIVKEWIKISQMQEGNRVLDIGPGPGVFTKEYAKIVRETGLVYAYEKSPEAISYLQKEIAEANLPNIKIRKVDAEVAIELDEEIIGLDIIMLTDVLHHTEDPAAILNNVSGLCSTKTKVVVSEFDPLGEGKIGPPTINRLAKAEVSRLAAIAGFDIITKGILPFEHYYLLLQKCK